MRLPSPPSHVSILSPFPSLPSVDLFRGTTFNEKSTCFVPWWMLDELITHRYGLDQINDGYEAMRKGENIRGVIMYD